jgi:hypothetical protein
MDDWFLVRYDIMRNPAGLNQSYMLNVITGGLIILPKPLDIVVDPPIDPNTPGNSITTPAPSDPSRLNHGDTVTTPDGSGDIAFYVSDTCQVDYLSAGLDETKPNHGLVLITDLTSSDVTENYLMNEVLPKSGTCNQSNSSPDDPNLPNTGATAGGDKSFAKNNIAYTAFVVFSALLFMITRVIVAKNIARIAAALGSLTVAPWL